MVLVFRPDMEEGYAVLGSGSIISRRHVLTAAHLVHGQDNEFRINFFVGTFRRTFNSTFALIHETFDFVTFANDIALIFLQGDDLFSEKNVIPISTLNAETGTAGTVAGYGFTSAQAIGFASDNPISANQTVAYNCTFEDNFEAAKSHFCAVDSVYGSIVCPGDNGAGLYIKNSTTGADELIGIASYVVKGCSKSGYTAYTRISQFSAWISAITNI